MLHDIQNHEAQKSQTAGSFYKFTLHYLNQVKVTSTWSSWQNHQPSISFFFFNPFWAFPAHSCTRHSVPQFKCISAIDFLYYFIFLRDAMDKLPSLKIQGLWECLPGYSGKEKPNWQDKRINISTLIVEKKGYMGWLLRAGGPNG